MITIFFATSTGKTEDIAQRLASLLGCPTELCDGDSLSSAQDFCRADARPGYSFTASRGLIQGRFCGLPIDEDAEPDRTDERLRAWAGQLNREMVALLS